MRNNKNKDKLKDKNKDKFDNVDQLDDVDYGAVPEHSKTFASLGLSEAMLERLAKKGFEEASPIQALVIPEFLKQQGNIIGQAQTGTGKTAAFAIPILETIQCEKGVVKALILAPTRELAIQVSDEIYSLTESNKIRVLPVYGGQSIDQQIKNIKRGIDIIVGTPGRVIDLIERKILHLKQLQFFVLDEADEMLNMGFIDDIEKILKNSNDDKLMLFFSATMPSSILKIAKNYMKDYKILKINAQTVTTNLTQQIYFEVRDFEKFDTLCRVLDFERDFYGIIFARTKHETDEVADKLKSRGYLTNALHGDVSQIQRNKILTSFKNKQINVLVATDVAARGIDVNNLSHVINYSLPTDPESYVHRIGRTGRAGKNGVAITFIKRSESFKLKRIQSITRTSIEKQRAPTLSEVFNAKKEALVACINEIIKEDDYHDYLDLASNLIAQNEPNIAIAALLRHKYGDQLIVTKGKQNDDLAMYDERDDGEVNDNTRLFIALGKKDAMTPRKLLELLYDEAKTPARKVQDIRILDNFSFITVPFAEAEIIMRTINQNKRRPLVTKAKER